MKTIVRLILFLCCLSGLNAFSQNSMTKTQRWEHSAFRVRTELHQLKRLEIITTNIAIDKSKFEEVKQKLLLKEGVIDVVWMNAHTVRMYYLNFVPVDYIEVMLNHLLTSFSLENIVQLAYNSQEVQNVIN